MAVTRVRRIAPPDDFPYPSTIAYGRDAYGIWQTVEVAGVDQTFRWCPPGQFTMGSPATEHGRSDDEDQREITLTKGFWLADTACPQALWSAVMGDNPSRSPGEDFPVESVSFFDVTAFCSQWRALGRKPKHLFLSVKGLTRLRSTLMDDIGIGKTNLIKFIATRLFRLRICRVIPGVSIRCMAMFWNGAQIGTVLMTHKMV
ncbi:hypothetical protein APED_27620 [Acanthopleuribacter pedis]